MDRISHTTRGPYTGEHDKKDYFFVSDNTFDSKIKQVNSDVISSFLT